MLMSLFAQHGYGKSDKIEIGLRASLIQGVIFGPKDEIPQNLERYIRELRAEFPTCEILFDPQFYVSTIIPARDGNLSNYPYYQPALTRRDFISSNRISEFVRNCLDYQVTLPLSYITSPTIIVENFQDPWSQIALSMAQESLTYHSSLNNVPPLLISFVCSEEALRSSEGLSEILDILSAIDVTGYYLIVKRSSPSYTAQIEQETLENFLYMVYALSNINEYEIIVGYSDINGVLLQSVGAKATACGWHNSLRQFSLGRFQPASGGQRPRPRYTAMPLLNSILVIPELVSIYNLGQISSVLTGTDFDSVFRVNPGNASWPANISVLHHWASLNNEIQRLQAINTVRERMQYILERIRQAEILYERLKRRGVSFDISSSSRHLSQWKNAIRTFISAAGV